MENTKIIFKELPVEQVEQDADQPRKDFGVEGDQNRLMLSIQHYGIEDPIKVSQIEENRYKIMDGHRRYKCALRLNWKFVPCVIYPGMSDGEFEARRYEIQNNRRNWKPMEKSNSLQRIKNKLDLRTNKELAEILGLSVTAISSSLQLRELRFDYLELMEKYGLSEAYRMEFARLRPKLRRIKNYEVDEIVKIIFDKVRNNVIRNSKEFRKLGKIFSRATANEPELYNFLSNPDTTIIELDQRTIQTGFSLTIEQAIQDIGAKRRDGVAFSSKERGLLEQLLNLLKKTL